jgi:hypothetical protein
MTRLLLKEVKQLMKQYGLTIGTKTNGVWKAKTRKQMIVELNDYNITIGGGAGASSFEKDVKNNEHIRQQKIAIQARHIIASGDKFNENFQNAPIVVKNKVREFSQWKKKKAYMEESP